MSEQPAKQARGREIKRRRLLYGIGSIRRFVEMTGLSREAITAAEKGEASDVTYDRLEAWLNSYHPDEHDEPHDDVVEFVVTGKSGVSVTVRGPVSDLAALEAVAVRLTRNVGDQDDE